MSNKAAQKTQGDYTLEQVVSRLERMESKIDNLQEAVVKMARTEERVVQLMESDGHKNKTISELQGRVGKLERELGEQKIKFDQESENKDNAKRRAFKIFLAFLTAALTAVVSTAVMIFREISS